MPEPDAGTTLSRPPLSRAQAGLQRWPASQRGLDLTGRAAQQGQAGAHQFVLRNAGGGGGAVSYSGAGGSGIVIIKYRFQ